MPAPSALQASLAGRVVGPDGAAVAGATVGVAETDAATITDADGAYRLMLPAESTVTLVVSATSFARTYRESVVLAAHASVTRFDVLLLPTSLVMSMNTLATAPAAGGGLMALRMHSMDARCTLGGSRLAVWPPRAATVVYARPAGPGAIDQPDASLQQVQAGGAIQAWLVGVVPPANMLRITVDQPGCQLMTTAPSMDGLFFPGARRAEAQALTDGDLFLTATP